METAKPSNGRRVGWRRLRPRARQLADEILRAQQEIADGLWTDSGYYGWYGCSEDGCCVDSQWWAPAMPSHVFQRGGLVHISRRWDGTLAYCGVKAVPYGVQLISTDAAREYAELLAMHDEEVTCLKCIVYDDIARADDELL